MFEWHFTIRGPTETPYENGIYHGKIILPSNWPMSPPDIYFLTVRWLVFRPIFLGERTVCYQQKDLFDDHVVSQRGMGAIVDVSFFCVPVTPS